MPIIVNVDVMMAKRKMSLNELSEKVDLTLSNLSILKTGKAKAIRFSTLDAICKALDCQPGDILEYVNDNKTTKNKTQPATRRNRKGNKTRQRHKETKQGQTTTDKRTRENNTTQQKRAQR